VPASSLFGLNSVELAVHSHDWKNLRSVRSSSLDETASLEKTTPDAQWIAGTAVLFRVSALKQIGLLDEKLFEYFEDNDISARLTAGWKTALHSMPRWPTPVTKAMIPTAHATFSI